MSPPDHSSATPVLAIIIATYNRLSYLIETLEHLQPYLSPEVEVIVIDDASTDATPTEIPRRFPWLTYLRCNQRRGPSLARNLGLEHTRATHFTSLDSDCFIVPETLHWLVGTLQGNDSLNLLLPCRSWPQGRRSVPESGDRPYTTKDILLKTYGEVFPVLSLKTLRDHGLAYPKLFAGGEPLLFAEFSRHEPLLFVDRVLLEFRTDSGSRISSAQYQLEHPEKIAAVFQAYLPYLENQKDRELRREHARVLEKLGVYLALAGDKKGALRYLARSLRMGRVSPLVFTLAALLPTDWLRCLFATYRRRQPQA